MEEPEAASVKIFYAYAREDQKLRDELEKHLANLRWQGTISSWSDRNINAGDEWEHSINTNLNDADIVLLLISPDFMNSKYCYSIELNEALERHTAKQTEVIPILLRSVDFEGSLFSHLQALPANAKPVKTWNDLDDAFLDIVKQLRTTINKLLIQKYLQKANYFLKNKQLGQATVTCNKAIRFDSKIGEFHSIKGHALFSLNKYEEALEAYRGASELEPDNSSNHRNMGNILYNYLCRYEEALEAYRGASELEPDNASNYRNMGNILHGKLCRYDDAINAYRRASELEPSNTYNYKKMGSILYRKLCRYEESLEAYKKLSELEPDNVHHYTIMGEILYSGLHRYEEALIVYKKLRELEPKNAFNCIMMGEIFFLCLNRYDDAIEAYRMASELEPDNASNYSTMGEIFFLCLERYNDAIEAYKMASELEPGNDHHYRKMAEIYERWAQKLQEEATSIRTLLDQRKKSYHDKL